MPKCKNDPTRNYKGTEPSPKGLGYCAHAEKLKSTKKGKDGNTWIVVQTGNKIKRWQLKSSNSSIDLSSFVKRITVNFSVLKPIKSNPFQLHANEKGLSVQMPNELMPSLNKSKVNLQFTKFNIDIQNGKTIMVNAVKDGMVIDIWLECKKSAKLYETCITTFTKNTYDVQFVDARFQKQIKLHHYGSLIQLTSALVKKLKPNQKYYVIDSVGGQGWDEDYTGKYYIKTMTPSQLNEFYFSGDFSFSDFDFPIFIVKSWAKTFNSKKLPAASLLK